ncbi:hypothetical protein BsWGS_14148 [Bradybaena similaris]
MCWRLHCPFRTRAAPEVRSTGDEITNILIFGITGMTGGAVLDATLGCAWFRVSGFSRVKKGQFYDYLVAKGVRMFTGDMNKPETLAIAMQGIHTVFLVTAYWDTCSVEMEFAQGVNVINMAIENDVKHLIYVGTDYSVATDCHKCHYLEGKARVENYIVSGGIPFTIIHMGFYFENLMSLFKPHRTGVNKFALAIPMEEVALNCGSVYDFGCCIGKIALDPHLYMFRTIELATSYLTVADMASKLDEYYSTMTFYDPKITIADYKTLELPETRALASMFRHYQTLPQWERTGTYDLYPAWRSFENWIKDSDKDFLSIIYGNKMESSIDPSYGPDSEWRKRPKFLSWMPSSRSLETKTMAAAAADRSTDIDAKYQELVYSMKEYSFRGITERVESAFGTSSPKK